MTEPVAYRVDGTIYNNIGEAEFAVRETERLRRSLGIDNGLIRRPVSIEPLYTAEQLRPRVKMTQAEFDEWFKLYNKKSFLIPINFLNLISNLENGYPLIYNIYLEGREKQLELLELWLRFKQENPEETIEIAPDMKWFVRSKEPEEYDDEYYIFLSGSNLDDLDYLAFDYARAFDTKEEAEKWLNPLTEAVQLPVEGE